MLQLDKSNKKRFLNETQRFKDYRRNVVFRGYVDESRTIDNKSNPSN